jgi:hypothetical protein
MTISAVPNPFLACLLTAQGMGASWKTGRPYESRFCSKSAGILQVKIR